MKQLSAIAILTLKAAFRNKLVVVTGLLLIAAVTALPSIVKNDDTANGFIQIVLTYTLTVVVALLGFVTLWLACGTLARDVEECQMQVVAVKPVPRWKIWLGKWLGIMALNVIFLSLSGVIIYAMILWKADDLPPDQQAKLRQEVLVARAAVTEPVPDLEPQIEKVFQEARQREDVAQSDLWILRRHVEELVKREYQLVRPDHLRRWKLDFGSKKNSLKDQPLYVRIKFRTPQLMEVNDDPNTYLTVWRVGDPDNPMRMSKPMMLAPGAYHEFQIPPNLVSEDGILTIDMENRSDTPLYVPLDDPLQVLYRESGFAVNFARGMVILFCWLGLLAIIGLSAASYLSFPVAAFCALSILIIGFSTGTISATLKEGSILGIDYNDTQQTVSPVLDTILLPVFRGLLQIIKLAKDFSPIDSLSTGRSITWFELARAVSQIVLLLGGIIAALGILAFNRRELATAQGNH